jgi:iron complex outermembrane recepter protein
MLPEVLPMQLLRFLSSGLMAFGAFIAATGIARAADSADDPLQSVVVTATKRQTDLLETPISMTVLNAETLKAVDADSFGDVTRLVPGLTAIDSGPGQKRYALRGLQSAGEPEVALYYDEIPISGLPGNSLDTGDDQPDIKLWDAQRVEVLRGPQGTLYGNGSMGGAIRILSKQPVLDHLTGATEVEGGVTDGGGPSWRWNGMVNAPVIDGRVALRLTGYYRRDGGWIDESTVADTHVNQFTGRALNWEHTSGARASLLFQVTDHWTVTGIAYYQDLKTGNTNEIYPDYATPDDRYVAKAFIRTPWDDLSRMANIISTLELNWAEFVVTGSWQQRSADLNIGTTRTNLSLFGCNLATWNVTCFGQPIVPADSLAHESVNAYSAETRLVSKSSGPLRWTVGSFLQRSTTVRDGVVATSNAAGYPDFDPITGLPVTEVFARNNTDHFNQYAFFGESTYKVFAALEATVGLRWFHSTRTDQQVIVHQFRPTAPVGAEPYQEFGEDALFKKFELAYSFNPNALLYIEAAQGFRAGGPNYPGGFAATAPPYRADSIWDYELGWKLSFDDRRIAWTGALFRVNWTDLQQLVPTTLFSYITNAGKARSDGFETELQAKVGSGFNFVAGATFNNAHLIGAQPLSSNPSAQLYAGQRLGGVPQWTVNAAVSYNRSLTNGLTFDIRSDYTYQSGRPSVVATESPAYFSIPGGSLTSLHIGLGRRENWQASVHVDNLFDRYLAVSAKSLDGNFVHSVTAARPRTLRLTLNKQFYND